jgi:hypothetical protein
MKQTMDNITNVVPETLWDNVNIKWTVKSEIVYPEVIDMPSYNYGNWQNTLDAWLALRNFSTWWKMKIWHFTITTTWNISITGVWFKPKLVKFSVCNNSNWTWIWAMESTAQFAIDLNSKSDLQSQCIYYRDAWWTVITRAVYVSMDSDWFTINVTFHSWYTTSVNYECFW